MFAEFCQTSANMLQIVARLVAIFGKHLEHTYDCRAVQRSVFCRSRRELSNAYLIAKFGFDTAFDAVCLAELVAVHIVLVKLPFAIRSSTVPCQMLL